MYVHTYMCDFNLLFLLLSKKTKFVFFLKNVFYLSISHSKEKKKILKCFLYNAYACQAKRFLIVASSLRSFVRAFVDLFRNRLSREEEQFEFMPCLLNKLNSQFVFRQLCLLLIELLVRHSLSLGEIRYCIIVHE